MQRALPGVRKSQRGILRVASDKWPEITSQHGPLRKFLPSRRHISFPSFIPDAPSADEQLPARGRGRGAQDVTFSEALRRAIDKALSSQHEVRNADTTLPQEGSTLYGKWHRLSLDQDRMLHEFDVNVSDSTMVRLIDQPGNEHDIQLWTCLIDFAHRHMGRDGILMIWQSVSKRRNLSQIDGPLAPRFWKTVLDAAVSDEKLLGDVLNYAQWLYRTHGVRWPGLYCTVITHFLQCHGSKNHSLESREAVMRWHSALVSSFGPSEDEFAVLMRMFAAKKSRCNFKILQSLYIENPYRRMYDIIIPHLYSEGHAAPAKRWREVLLEHKDVPTSPCARPFLRYLGSYTKISLTEDELKVAGLVSNKLEPDQPTSQRPETAIQNQNLDYLINRVHGETFGIAEKPYNDSVGAKWFASSWVSVDFALNVIYTMGVQAIGPLSLQSIALREKDASGVLRRLDQLRQLQIKLPKTQYANAIRYYASVGDDEALQELLHCDIHPDLFDHKLAQQQLLSDCIRVGNWSTYRLVMKTHLTAMAVSRGATTNRVLESCIRQGNGYMILKIMQEMASQRYKLEPLVSHYISSFILQSVSPHADEKQRSSKAARKHLDLHIRLARELAATRFPPAVEVWQVLLYRLGREKRLNDLERLCLFILRMYSDYTCSQEPLWTAHVADVPAIMRSELPFPKFQKLPRDLPIHNRKHPLCQIFDGKLQSSIVRWGFMYTSYDHKAEGAAADLLHETNAAEDEPPGDRAGTRWLASEFIVPAKFHMARGIRLLAMLRDAGMFVLQPSVRKQAELRLVDLFRGEGRAEHEWVGGNQRLTWLRRQLRLSLPEAKKLCDTAWNEKKELLPSLLEMELKIEGQERLDEQKAMQKRLDLIKDPQLARKVRVKSI